MPKVSVIVPVYKVEPFIESCARSLFDQTLDDIEYIFVDDCTPDRSMEILREVLSAYSGRNDRVKWLRMPVNSGLPAVRKAGWEDSSGDYVIHCDSDDRVERDFCEKLYGKALSEGADLVVCDYYAETEGASARTDACGEEDRDLTARLLCGEVPGYNWNKLVRRDLFGQVVHWPVANMWEDKVLSVQHICNSRKTVFLHEPLYHYRISSAGMCLSGEARRKVAQLEGNVAVILSFLEERGLSDRYRREAAVLKAYAQMHAMPPPRKEYLSVYPENRWRQLFLSELPFSIRLGHLTKMLGIHGISGVFRR